MFWFYYVGASFSCCVLSAVGDSFWMPCRPIQRYSERDGHDNNNNKKTEIMAFEVEAFGASLSAQS